MFTKQMPKTRFPKIHENVRQAAGVDESLSLYVEKKITVPALSDFAYEMEQKICELLMSLSSPACFFQFIHPSNMEAYQRIDLFISAINENRTQLKNFLGKATWIEIDLDSVTSVVTFRNNENNKITFSLDLDITNSIHIDPEGDMSL